MTQFNGPIYLSHFFLIFLFFFPFPWIFLIWGCFLSHTLLRRANDLALNELRPRRLLIRHIISFLHRWLVLKDQKVWTCHKKFTTCKIFALKLYSICYFINVFYHSTQSSPRIIIVFADTVFSWGSSFLSCTFIKSIALMYFPRFFSFCV